MKKYKKCFLLDPKKGENEDRFPGPFSPDSSIYNNRND